MTIPPPAPHRRPRSARVLGVLGVVCVLAALGWGAAVVMSWAERLEELPRTEVPGELSVTLEEDEGRVVYFERRTFTTPPAPGALEVEVTGPDGQPVAVEAYEGVVTYRAFRLGGRAHATFEAAQTGTHTVRVDGEVPDDASVTVGPGLSTWPFWELAGPALLLMLGLVLGIVAIVRAVRHRRPPVETGQDAWPR